jgi:hypothetical protein
MVAVTSKERFDDVGPQDSDGYYEYAYHGYNYVIGVDERTFLVRTYDDEPGVATVIDPTDARTCAEARLLVQFIAATLGCTSVQFYCGPVGTYRPVDIQTLEFLKR